MKAQELWNKYTTDSSLTYEAWAFGDDPDGLAQLVVDGIKTATSSAYIFYELENEKIPKVGEYSVILNSKDEAKAYTKEVNETGVDSFAKQEPKQEPLNIRHEGDTFVSSQK